MAKTLSLILFIFLFVSVCFPGESLQVYTKDNNIYIKDNEGNERRLTFQNKDCNPVLSPNSEKIIFIRYIKPCPYNSDTGWFPSDHDEVWSINVDGSDQRCIIKNNHSENVDMRNYLGSFDSLHISANSKKIYFLCQNCSTDAILYIADIDGSNIKRVCNAHQLDLVGGNPDHKYYGYLVIGQRQLSKDSNKIKWTSILLDADGNKLTEIENVEKFWSENKKM